MPKYPIIEIFDSIQGEGLNLGKQATFIRLAGCNLNCPWCDTNWKEAKESLELEEILKRVPARALVVITGGEPFMNKQLASLVIALIGEKHQVAIETNGTYDGSELRDYWGTKQLFIACSPKPETGWKIHPQCQFDELKFVIDEKITSQDIFSACRGTSKTVWLQPEGSTMQASWKKALQIQEHLAKAHVETRIGIQLHKIMEVR